MSDKVNDAVSAAAGNASGGRKGLPDTNDAGRAISGVTGGAPIALPTAGEDKDANAGFGLDNFEKDVKGSLKVHIKIIARIKGDIAIGLL